jgi:carbonic anhydrase
MDDWKIIEANHGARIATARELFIEYANSLGVNLCFQGFEAELENLPGAYGPPDGRLFLASGKAGWLGCVALRPRLVIDARVCEMKRLYVRPAARGAGVGRGLASDAIQAARTIGYRRMVLDTLATMEAAMELYRSLGFRETAAYYANPIPEARYFALEL